MEAMRTRYQGVTNIIRFNWHFYAIAAAAALLALLIAPHLGNLLGWIVWAGLAAGLISTLLSLAISHYIYDRSPLYDLHWIKDISGEVTIVNINAGFDETSAIIENHLTRADLHIWDFYDEAKHTEVSIKRARQQYPPHLKTITIDTCNLPLTDRSADVIVFFMALHEVRDPKERECFLNEAHRILKNDGKIIITEHLRDLPNFLAYTIGFLHFYGRTTWEKSFASAGLTVVEKKKTTPFVSTFFLAKL